MAKLILSQYFNKIMILDLAAGGANLSGATASFVDAGTATKTKISQSALLPDEATVVGSRG
jgi:hypothetical protein